jgi:hypothetical protein
MIVATVELKSAVSKTRDKIQATIEISNVAGSKTKADYRYRIYGKGGQTLHEGLIRDFPRKQWLAIDLLLLCLVDARGRRVLAENG